jgi:broad specificity phosphatase PhoE
MNQLILIKHASPQVDPAAPPERWHLSDRGRASCAALAEAIGPHEPSIIISSTEVKAIETAELLASALNLQSTTAPGLEEHDRSNVPHLRSAEFISMMELFFRKPNELVLGRETAEAALARFSKALEAAIAAHPGENVAVISHGTVIALLLGRLAETDGFRLWREMGLPSLAVLDIPTLKPQQIVPRLV